MRMILSGRIEVINMNEFKKHPDCPYCLLPIEELVEWQETFVDSNGFEAKCEKCGDWVYAHPKVTLGINGGVKFIVEKLEEEDYE